MKLKTNRGAKALALFAAVSMVAGCGLPRSGPNKKEIYAGSVLKEGDAYIVTVNSRVTRATSVMPAFGFSENFRNAGLVGADTISAGDVLAVTVYENVRDDPLLGNTGQRVSQLTEVQVDGQGFIFIPYAGRIKAAGNSVESVRSSISRKLDAQTPDPQVQVARVAGDGSTVTITGAVATPGVFPIEQSTRSLSAMLAQSGAMAIDPATALVRVTRGGSTGKIWLKDLWANPKMDIALRPGDRIVIEEDERRFTALGATGTQSIVPFESETLSAIEALATVGGLQTMAADPTGVFVLRNEPEAIANAVLGRKDLRGDQRMIYVLDLTAPTGMFEARDFLVRDGDTIYVTEAPYVQWQKSLSVLTGSAGAAASLDAAAGGS